MMGIGIGADFAGFEVPPPKTLITPALFSRPLPTPLTGRRGRQAGKPFVLPSPSPGEGGGRGRERGLGGEGPPRRGVLGGGEVRP